MLVRIRHRTGHTRHQCQLFRHCSSCTTYCRDSPPDHQGTVHTTLPPQHIPSHTGRTCSICRLARSRPRTARTLQHLQCDCCTPSTLSGQRLAAALDRTVRKLPQHQPSLSQRSQLRMCRGRLSCRRRRGRRSRRALNNGGRTRSGVSHIAGRSILDRRRMSRR